MLSDIASRCLFFPAALFKLCPSLYVYHGNLTCNVAVTERLHERAMLHEKRGVDRRVILRESKRPTSDLMFFISCVIWHSNLVKWFVPCVSQ